MHGFGLLRSEEPAGVSAAAGYHRLVCSLATSLSAGSDRAEWTAGCLRSCRGSDTQGSGSVSSDELGAALATLGRGDANSGAPRGRPAPLACRSNPLGLTIP